MFCLLRGSTVVATVLLIGVPITGEGAVVSKGFDSKELTSGGAIASWLLLGPYYYDSGGGVGLEPSTMRLDFLTDGQQIVEADVMPHPGDQVHTDYGVAASTGLARMGEANPDVNPEGIPQWYAWEQQEDLIELDTPLLYGMVDETMCYAVCYLDVEWDMTVAVGCGSDDLIQILVDDQEVLLSAEPRAWAGFEDASPPFDLSAGVHRLMVKVFDLRGLWCFGCRIQDALGEPLREGYAVRLSPVDQEPPETQLRRGDANSDGDVNIADAVYTLEHLFARGPRPMCRDAADTNDDGAVDIGDAIYTLQNLFANGPAIPPPYPDCGLDPTVDNLGCVEYAPCE